LLNRAVNNSEKVFAMGKALFHIMLAAAVFFINIHSVNWAFGGTPELPFHAGEKMTFQVKWLSVLAGEATIELLPPETLNSEDSNHFLFTVRTSEFADIFYKVRDRIESYADANMTHSLLYTECHRGKSMKDASVDFDWVKQEAQYSKKGESEKRPPVAIVPGTFDPLSVFFAFRLIDLNEKSEIILPATDGKKMVLGKVNVVRKEVIKVNGISYDTFLVEPELGDLGGVFDKSKDAKLQIWVTADNRHIPVRMKSKVAVGSFIAELTSYYEGTETERLDPAVNPSTELSVMSPSTILGTMSGSNSLSNELQNDDANTQ
jgi:hypothetical protein